MKSIPRQNKLTGQPIKLQCRHLAIFICNVHGAPLFAGNPDGQRLWRAHALRLDPIFQYQTRLAPLGSGLQHIPETGLEPEVRRTGDVAASPRSHLPAYRFKKKFERQPQLLLIVQSETLRVLRK